VFDFQTQNSPRYTGGVTVTVVRQAKLEAGSWRNPAGASPVQVK